ncbi:MAG TPA: hypothetical protein VGE07_17145 [Herpetosiphonaceae bacterium]
MDDQSLTEILCSLEGRQLWLKPVGEPGQPVGEGERYDGASLRIDFARQPAAVAAGDLLLVYRVGLGKLATVAECLEPPAEAGAEEQRREPGRERWRWSVRCRNRSPEYAARWLEHDLRPFELARAYGELQPNDRPRLGAINFGSDKLRLSLGFGAWLLHQIIAL